MEYKLWNGGEVILVELDAEPRDNDVIVHEGIEYTVGGRRFEGGALHYAVTPPPRSVYDDPNYRMPTF